MDIVLLLRPSHNSLPESVHRPKASITACLHEPDNDAECPILQESIKNTTGLDWFPRPFDATKPTFSAITLPCKHTFHAMALVYNWGRNKHVLCPVCRAGPKCHQLVVSKLPKNWKYSLAARLRREWKQDKEKAEEEDRQVAESMASVPQPRTLNFTVILRIEALESNIKWMGLALPIPGTSALIFHIPPSEIASVPFVTGDRVRILPFLHVHPANFISHLPITPWFELGLEDPGYNFSIRFNTIDPTQIAHFLFTISDDQFAQALATSLMILNEV